MKNYFKNISPYIIVILVLVIALILTKQCQRCPVCPEPTTTVITKTDTIRDTTVITKTIYKLLPKDTVYIEVPTDVDTDEILKDYYAKKYYNNIYLDDTSAYIGIEDTVFKNEIYSSKLTFINRRPTIINTTTYVTQYDICEPCKQFNIGVGGLIGGYTDKFGAGPSIMLTTNKKASYSASYDIINKTGYFGLYWNIK
ncbi:MAG: hypothetical protein EOL97_15640 [Spirochaetia bacterium]|nr:hypothetical protein [Spirochaetia bacterium]